MTQKGKVVKYAIPAGVSVQHDDNVIFPDCMLYQNFPNPFNRETTISYSLSQPAFIKLTIYDVLGREVETLVNEFQSSGYYTIDYNAENLCGGIYVYKINAGKGIKLTKRMLCLK